jgi:thiamine phosphate synthase YjbQ (UPF0047 family)
MDLNIDAASSLAEAAVWIAPDTNVTARVYSHALPADDQRAAHVWDSIVGASCRNPIPRGKW